MPSIQNKQASSSLVQRRAFTLTEVLTVTVIIALIAMFSMPWLRQMLVRYQLKTSSQLVMEAFRTAQLRARTGRTESSIPTPWGVHVGLGVLFDGTLLANATGVTERFDASPISTTGIVETADGHVLNKQELYFRQTDGRPMVMDTTVEPPVPREVAQAKFTLTNPIFGQRVFLFVCPYSIFITNILRPDQTYVYICGSDVDNGGDQ